MSATTTIAWCNHTFNPWRGCTKVSAGCTHCYAEKMSKRNPKVLGTWGDDGVRVVAAEAYWRLPLKWDREAKAAGERRRVFCASIADVFEDWVGKMHDVQARVIWWDNDDKTMCSTTNDADGVYRNHATMDDFRTRLFRLIDQTPNLDWLLLTKRPENIVRMMPCRHNADDWPRKNIWLGTTVEDQDTARRRVPVILKVPATVHFLSGEPLLSGLDVYEWLFSDHDRAGMNRQYLSPLPGTDGARRWFSKVDWIIAGCESGHGRRPMQLEWPEMILDQCNAAGTAFFMKQMDINGKVSDVVSEFPEHLQVQEFPEVAP